MSVHVLPNTDSADVREMLYQQPSITQALVLVDDYMGRARKLGGQFQIPPRDVWMLPLITRYTDDLPGFVKFVRGIRNEWTGREQYAELRAFYHLVSQRYLQQWLRARHNQALAWLDRHYPGCSTAER